ncbi:thiamine ABC transporter substrate binding subunit [Neptunomonas sp. CHC150]|uniref:thiamine ABC transporter substrate binding subunit n=1 Tax=Neptunomonas sp. CHC150 TaxID=2998324 RepID=UPI0025B27B05|nr:thiamine ABC transporter substrate binding subunit [Neptunomonas sp. CHC150]MDN2659397.1 thiamine ABC transporter substrate binding subunit [Neptunomonas sp. CHC150]
MKRTSLFTLAASALLTSSCFAADLTIYTYDSFNSEWGPGPQLEKSFEAQCQCDIEFIAVDDGVSILNRARIEKASTKADVLLGLDDSLTQVTRDEGLVQAHGVDLSSLTSALAWDDEDFVPFDYGYFSFIYDSSKIAQPADSLKALISSNASVIYQDPRTSTPGQGLMLWVNAVYGDEAASAWTELAKHTVTVTKGWWEAYSMFLEGGADYVLSYNTSLAYHAVVDGESKYKAALFDEGHIAQVEVAAISQYSNNPELAKQFLSFLISPEAQHIIPTTNWMLPVIDNVELPAPFSSLITPKRLNFTPAQVAEQRKAMISTWRSSAQ